MVKIRYLFILQLIIYALICSDLLAQNKVRVSGFIKDKISGELLIGANVFDINSKSGIVTDYNGYFSISIQTPSVLQFSFVGYTHQIVHFNNTKDTLINIELIPGTEMAEVIINAQQKDKINVSSIGTKELMQIPSLGGKPDVCKSLQLLPGIYSQNEGSSLLLVRGGDPGQNLYLFDNIPVIYVNHLGGFTSVFNPEIINNIDVYKGGFPSRYGSKLSSIVDIVQKEGDKSHLKGSLNIGLTDVSLLIEGPLKLKNTSFIIAGRKTMIDPLLALASNLSEGNDFNIAYGFHDINGKITWKPNFRNSFSFNVYEGDDYLNYWSDREKEDVMGKHRFKYIWGNLLLSAHWKAALSSKIYNSNSISYTRYRLKENFKYSLPSQINTSDFQQLYLSSVQDLSIRSNIKYNVLKNYLMEFGFQTSLLFHLPNYTSVSGGNSKQSEKTIKSNESALFMDNKFTFFNNSQIVTGFRIVDYKSGRFNDFSIEPRVNLNIAVNPDHLLNFSYMSVKQYSHLLFTSGNLLNNEVWVPANNIRLPSNSDQYTIGWNGNFKNDIFYSEINFFYKKLRNLVTYKEGYSTLKGDDNWQTKIESGGIGNVQGCEFLVKKNSGKWTGFAGYTLSKATRQYPNINNGKEFLFDFDRLHSFSISSNYKINEKLNLSLSWVYQTGLPYTPAVGRQNVPSLDPNENGEYFLYEALIYGERNSERMKDYHRLDIGLNYETVTIRGRKAVWNFSVYNLYNRHNPYYYYYNNNNSDEIYIPEFGDETKPLALYQKSYFPIIPSFSYKVFFDDYSRNNKNKAKFKQRFKNWLYHKN
jgi:hypothetical protein